MCDKPKKKYTVENDLTDKKSQKSNTKEKKSFLAQRNLKTVDQKEYWALSKSEPRSEIDQKQSTNVYDGD